MRKAVPYNFLPFHLILAISLLLVPEARAKILYVGPNEAYTNIQWAVGQASHGDTIIVKDGVYTKFVKINKSVVLMAENLHKAVIGDGSGAKHMMAIRFDSVNNVVIDGFKFVPASNYMGIFVSDLDPEAAASNCIIRNNLIEGRKKGIGVSPTARNTTITGNIIKECTGPGIDFAGYGKNEISHNTIEDGAQGIYIGLRQDQFYGEPGTVLVRGNEILNDTAGGINIDHRPHVTLERNIIDNCKYGIQTNSGIGGLMIQDSNQVVNNIEQGIFIERGTLATIIDNVISGNGQEGIRNHGQSVITGNRIEGNSGMGIWATSETAYIEENDIHSNGIHGIEIGYGTDDVRVYNNRITGNHEFGIFAGDSALIQGNLIDGNGQHGVYVAESCKNVEIISDTISNNLGREIFITNSSSALIKYNILEDDTTNMDLRNGHGGIVIEGSARIEGNQIRKMNGSAIYIAEMAGEVVINKGNTLEYNRDGIVVLAPAKIDDNIISHNREKGVWIGRPSQDVSLMRNKIRNNVTGVFYQSGIPNLTLTGNTFSENNTGVVSAGEAMLRSNTIQRNVSIGIKIKRKGIDLGNETAADSGLNAILENGEWNITNESEDSIPAWYNYWGMSDADSIDATIWDNDEDSLVGPVLFESFLGDLNVGVDKSIVRRESSGTIPDLEAFPNPFRYLVTIRFVLHDPQEVQLNVIDFSGRNIRSVINTQHYPPGEHQTAWDGCTDGGQMAPEGLFLVVLRAGREVLVQKVVHHH